ncbi:MAG: PAS domain S-box protein [Methanobacterium sp.]
MNFRELFNNSPIGILFCDKNGKLIDANKLALQIAEIPSLNDSGEYNLFNNTNIASNNKKLMKNGLIKFQTSIDSENNKNTIFKWIVSIIDSGFLVQIQDITGRKKSEDSLRKSEEKYHRLFDDDLTGDFIATPEGIVLECNPSFVEIYGFYKIDQAVGSDISKFNMTDWVNLVARLKIECKIKGYQSWQRRHDGKEIHVVANVVGIFSDSGVLTQVKGYVFDDTDRKNAEDSLRKSEEKYHRLFDDDLTGDFIATLEGKILECNPSFADIYGLDDCKNIDKLNISNFNSFDWPYLITRLKSERKIKGFHSWQRRPDGMRIHVVANVVGIFSDSGVLTQVKGYVFDDTDRKKAEEELANSKHQITEILDSIQDGFVSLNHYWNLIYVNRRAAEYASVEPEDLIGQNLWKRFPELVGTSYETAFRKTMNEKEIHHFEEMGIHTHDHWFDVSVYPSVDGISIYWRDMTNIKSTREN